MQVTAQRGRPWTVLDLCELQLKLQLGGLGEPGSVVAAVARNWKETAQAMGCIGTVTVNNGSVHTQQRASGRPIGKALRVPLAEQAQREAGS